MNQLTAALWTTMMLVSGVVMAAAAPATGVAVEGQDRATVLVPEGTVVRAYENAGYRLSVEDGVARVRVDAAPFASETSFSLPDDLDTDDPVTRVASVAVTGARTHYAAASRILGWVARNIDYELDRSQSQAAGDVLARRSGYCTGVARLTVGLLRAVGIEAREVAGYVVGDDDFRLVGANGYHRWVELELPDVGWLFSDPLVSHFYVPATYVRLASEHVVGPQPSTGLLLERERRLAAVDLFPSGAPGITARRRDGRQLAAALRIHVEGRLAGLAVLEGRTVRYTRALQAGEAIFVGLDPGRYTLRLELAGWRTVTRVVELEGRVRSALYVPLAALGQSVGGATTDARD